MLYFSELKGKKVITEEGKEVGKLVDLSFLVSDTPKITTFVIRDLQNYKLHIPSASIKNINHVITVERNFQPQEISDQELYLERNLLDKQIIDIAGSKVVRVNDIAINDKPGYYIAGADIGLLGVLRWLKIADITTRIFKKLQIKLNPQFLSWGDIQPLELARGMVILKTQQERLKKILPEDLADYLEKINIVNVDRILKSFDEKYAADVISSLNINYQTALFRQFSPEKAAHIISLIDSDEAVDILLTLTERRREEIILLVPPHKVKQIRHLMHLARTPIGEKMTAEYLTIASDKTVKDTISKIKKEAVNLSFLNYVYVLNNEEKLVGIFSLHEMLLQNMDTPVYKFMTQNIVVIHLTTPEEIALAKMFKYKLNAVPVIDNDRHLLGIVAFDDLPDLVLNQLK